MKASTLFQRVIAEDAPVVPSVQVEIAPGELIDRITVLEIEVDRVADPTMRHDLRSELDRLRAARDAAIPSTPALDRLAAEMKQINARLRDIRNRIREHEANREFGPAFIALARALPRADDRRAAIRDRINALLGARIREPKSYSA
jgi:predicted  nucleic acid-binding Zn-ribbon protein